MRADPKWDFPLFIYATGPDAADVFLPPLPAPMSSASAQDAHVPSYYGVVETTLDALRLVHGAAQGIVPRIRRRLNESERRAMIHSGAVFVFAVEERCVHNFLDATSS